MKKKHTQIDFNCCYKTHLYHFKYMHTHHEHRWNDYHIQNEWKHSTWLVVLLKIILYHLFVCFHFLISEMAGKKSIWYSHLPSNWQINVAPPPVHMTQTDSDICFQTKSPWRKYIVYYYTICTYFVKYLNE